MSTSDHRWIYIMIQAYEKSLMHASIFAVNYQARAPAKSKD